MEEISYKRTAFKGEVVLSQRIIDGRFDCGMWANEMADEEILFLDETGFNLHIAVTRSWSQVDQTPVDIVPANKDPLSPLLCAFQLRA